MKSKKSLSKTLKAYSALAGAAIISGKTDAQVIYTDVNPDVTKAADGATYMLDLNNDATYDFSFVNMFYSSSGYTVAGVYASVLNQNAIAGNLNSGYPFPFALNSGAVIDNFITPWNGIGVNSGSNYFGIVVGPPYNISMGNWLNAVDKIAPLRIKISGQDHYGWARFTMNISMAGSSFTIKDYAYEASPNTGIIAGMIPSSVNENDLSAAKIHAYGNTITIDLGNEIRYEGNIIVTNVIGEQVFSQTISSSKTEISLNAAGGVYFVTIHNGANTITRKVYLQ